MDQQQMLDYYRAMFPGQMAAGMGNAPQGVSADAGGANALTKLALAMMQRNRMKQFQNQYPQQPALNQGQNLSMPAMSPMGMPEAP